MKKALIKNEEAQAGVGTLIIFIAMVLVAAVAAAVLIQTSGVMQSKSTTTTKEAAAAISENIVVDSVTGMSNTTTNLTGINITMKLAPGSSDVDLSKFTVKVKAQTYNYNSAGPSGSTGFGAMILRDPESGMGTVNNYATSGNPLLKPGALVRLDVSVDSLSELQTRKPVTISLIPEKGVAFNLPLTLPSIEANKLDITIYP